MPSNEEDTNKIIEIILILIFPPLAIWFHDKECGGQVCLNVCLLFLFAIPAYIHAVWYCFLREQRYTPGQPQTGMGQAQPVQHQPKV